MRALAQVFRGSGEGVRAGTAVVLLMSCCEDREPALMLTTAPQQALYPHHQRIFAHVSKPSPASSQPPNPVVLFCSRNNTTKCPRNAQTTQYTHSRAKFTPSLHPAHPALSNNLIADTQPLRIPAYRAAGRVQCYGAVSAITLLHYYSAKVGGGESHGSLHLTTARSVMHVRPRVHARARRPAGPGPRALLPGSAQATIALQQETARAPEPSGLHH